MLETKINISGDMGAALDRFTDKVKKDCLISGAAGAAEVIYKQVRANAPMSEKKHFFKGTNQTYGPYYPGALQRAIYRYFVRDKSDADRVIYVVRWSTALPPVGVPYGYMVEYGTSRAPKHPFMRPALSAMPDAGEAGLNRMRARMPR